jgi:hypothetical protein
MGVARLPLAARFLTAPQLSEHGRGRRAPSRQVIERSLSGAPQHHSRRLCCLPGARQIDGYGRVNCAASVPEYAGTSTWGIAPRCRSGRSNSRESGAPHAAQRPGHARASRRSARSRGRQPVVPERAVPPVGGSALQRRLEDERYGRRGFRIVRDRDQGSVRTHGRGSVSERSVTCRSAKAANGRLAELSQSIAQRRCSYNGRWKGHASANHDDTVSRSTTSSSARLARTQDWTSTSCSPSLAGYR